jgi:rifampin ADP-ribosylating transferase
MTTYFHGGRPGLPRGSFILPPTITKATSCSEYGAAGVHRRDRVYVVVSQEGALLYAAGHPSGKGWIYECEPIGQLEPDPDATVPGISFQCPKARVLRIFKPTPEQLHMARSVLFAGEPS